MDTTLSKPLTPDAKPATALPVLDLLNNLITVASTIGTAAKTTLPKSIINANPSLATAFTEWQDAAWQMLYEALVDARIFAEATEINSVFNEGITDQSVFQSLIMLDNGVPSVIAGCDDLEGNINQGLTLLSQLQTVASNIANADKQQIAQIQSLVDSLNTQFDSLEDKLDEKALDNSKQAVTTIINVGVAVAEEKDPISPLLNGIAQVGFEVIGELTISADINATLVQLESAWEQLDEATLQLAQVTLVINQMTAITNATHKTIEALNAIVNDWQTIADCINDTTTWSSTGANQLKEWAARMAHVQFYGQVSQTVTPSS